MRLTYSLPNVSSLLEEGSKPLCLEEYEGWFSSGLKIDNLVIGYG